MQRSKQRITYEAPLLALHSPQSRTEAITHVPQIITYMLRKKGMENKDKLSVEPCDASTVAATVGKKAHPGTKRHRTVKKSRLQLQPLPSYACLKALVSQSVSQSIDNSVNFLKFHNYFMEGYFWAWLCLTNPAQMSQSKCQADFWVIFLGQNSQTLMIPIYSTTVLYDAQRGLFEKKKIYIL